MQYQLKRPFSNGTTHVVFAPLDFLSKLAALIPRPRHHLVRYHGVLAPNAKLRKRVVPRSVAKGQKRKATTTSKHAPDPIKPEAVEEDLTAPLTWAQRLKRVFGIEITLCPKCGGRLRVIADVTDSVTIQKILDHVAQPPPSTRTGSKRQ